MAIKLAFSGKMRAGKDTAADYIITALNKDGWLVRRFAFADAIRRIRTYAQEVAGFPVEKDRAFDVWVGSEWGRGHDRDVWVNVLKRDMHLPENEECIIVVTDVRFPNELRMLQEEGFLVIRVQATDQVRLTRGADPDKMKGEPEVALDAADITHAFDIYLTNNGSLEEFHQKLDRLVGYAWEHTIAE